MTGRHDTIVVTGHGARAIPAWASRWLATCPAMPSANEQIADHLANRRVRADDRMVADQPGAQRVRRVGLDVPSAG
jgi:hypothetical protein